MRPFLPAAALLLLAIPALAQTVAPVTSTPLAAPGMSPPPGPLNRPPTDSGGSAAPTLVPATPMPPQGQAESRPIDRLPVPDLDDNAKPSAFVTAARTAIAAGRQGEAIEAIERAESRILVRSVRPSLAGVPSEQALVRTLADARAALARGDKPQALALLARALAEPTLDRPVE